MKHDFAVMSVKTANKDGKKYLGKAGTQAWRVSTKIGEEWHACMIWDEALLPVKGKEYNIELSENEGFKNWEYKLLTKKEQIQQQVEPKQFTENPITPDMIAEPPKNEFQDKVSRGASLNLSSQFMLYQACGGNLDLVNWLDMLQKHAKQIQPIQQKFVNQN